jgi:cytochrome c peroxidase
MNRNLSYLTMAALVGGTMSLMSCGEQKPAEDPTAKENARYDMDLAPKLAMFGTLPAVAAGAENDPKVKLGHALYFDPRLSKNETQSCNTCHNLATFGVDNKATSAGDLGQNGDRNSPTVLNAFLHSVQFWDGRAKDVEEQAGMPILNPVEMNIPNEKFLMDRLKGVPMYVEMFKAAYPADKDALTYTNLRTAIAAFERTLTTPSRFDKYLAGDKSALTLEEKKGMASFIGTGCTACHSGELVGGKMMQKFGVHANYWEYTKSTKIDKGVAALKGDSTQLYMFKTPSLRNVAETGPYFHDGSVADLKEAVTIMAKVNLNYTLSDAEAANIVAFLKSMTGEVPTFAKTAPAGLTASVN